MIRKLRHFMAHEPPPPTLGGEGQIVEIDETLLTVRSMGEVRRLAVFGMLDSMRIRTFVVPDRSGATLVPLIRAHLAPGSIVHTDQWQGYASLARLGIAHLSCNHASGFYIGRDGANTWRIDNYWGLLKSYLRRSARSCGTDQIELAIAQHAFLHNHRSDRVRLIDDLCRGRPLAW